MKKWQRKRSPSEAGLPEAPDDGQPRSDQPGDALSRCEEGVFDVGGRVETVLASASTAANKLSPGEGARNEGRAKWPDVLDAPYRGLMPGMIKIMPSGDRSGPGSHAEDCGSGSLTEDTFQKVFVGVSEDEVERWQAPWMAGLMDRARGDGEEKESSVDGGISGGGDSKPPQISDPARADDSKKEELSDLHHEILRFSEYVSLTPAEVEARENMKRSVKAAVVNAFGPRASVGFFGSYPRDERFGTNVTAPGENFSIFLSDVDIFVKPDGGGGGGMLLKKKSKEARSGLERFGKELQKNPWITGYEFHKCVSDGCVAPSIQVPGIACRDARSGVESDIVWGGHHGSEALAAQIGPAYFIAMFPETFLPLVKFLKVFMFQRDLDNPFTGGIGSSSCTCSWRPTWRLAGEAQVGVPCGHGIPDIQRGLPPLSKPTPANGGSSSSGEEDVVLVQVRAGDLELQRSRGRRGSILGRVIWGSDLRKEREDRLVAVGSAKASPAPHEPEPAWHRELKALSIPRPRDNTVISIEGGGSESKNANHGGGGAKGGPAGCRMQPPGKKMTKAEKKAARMSPAAQRKAAAQRQSAAERKAAGHFNGYKLKTIRKLSSNGVDETLKQKKKKARKGGGP